MRKTCKRCVCCLVLVLCDLSSGEVQDGELVESFGVWCSGFGVFLYLLHYIFPITLYFPKNAKILITKIKNQDFVLAGMVELEDPAI